MERYPCPYANKGCPQFYRKLGCRTVKHHVFWPASRYREGLETEFRELEVNQVIMCKDREEVLHTTTEPPPKPSAEVMAFCVGVERQKRELGV